MQLQRFKGVWLVLLGSLALPVVSRSQGTITANPAAVNMLDRQLWRMEGRATGDFQYDGGIGGGIDVNGDGYGDFFVNFEGEGKWKLFYGGPKPDTIAEWSVGNVLADPPYPVIGDFYGDGRKEIALGGRRMVEDTIRATTYRFYQLRLYQVDSGRIADTARLVYDPSSVVYDVPGDTSVRVVGTSGVYPVDCDRDRVSDLVISLPGIWRNGGWVDRPEVWIFKGGEGFQVGIPTVVVTDQEILSVGGYYYIGLGDIDGDGYVDMVTAAQYKDGRKLKFYWGNAESPWDWTEPDRVIVLDGDYPSITGNVFPAMMDLDGDGIKDMVFQGGFVYRSGRRKTVEARQERSYTLADADAELSGSKPFSGGYLNDSTRKYEMLLMTGQNTGYWFSGGANGVDTTYEAYYRDGWSGGTIFSVNGESVGDIDGDGWDDYGACNPRYGNVQGSLNSGVAVILRGGPSIPGPDRVSGVREVKLEGRSDAVRVWPNPVEDELIIVWRGDLKRTPSRFAVMNVLGQRVAYGEVEPWRGSVVWRCGEVPPGVYMVRVSDRTGEPITTVSVVKR